MNIGYARISTDTQTHSAQIAALKAAGCEKLFTDTASGAKREPKDMRLPLTWTRRLPSPSLQPIECHEVS